MIPKHTVIQYVRNKKRVPYGVIVAVKTDEGFSMGYSLCNKKDRFEKKMALKIALGRALWGNGVANKSQNKPHFCKENGLTYDNWETVQPPHDVRKMIPTFVNRCNKYYKV